MCPADGTKNLTPIKPGQVLNPEGINQYTYRADAERDLAKWCKKYGRELIEKLLEEAKGGDATMMRMALERILPAVQQHDIALIDSADPGLADRLAALVRSRKGNGRDTSDEPLGPEGDQ